MRGNMKTVLKCALAAFFVIVIVLTLGCRRKPGDEGVIHQDDYQKAYVYAYPMIANYKAMYEFNIDKSSPQYKGPFNTVVSDSNVFTPKDTAVLMPNLDTPHSM